MFARVRVVAALLALVVAVPAIAAPDATSSANSAGKTARSGSGMVILVLGDSLSAEYGIQRGTGWVPLLADRLRDRKFDGSVVNASVSGDTTSGGLARLPALLEQHRPALVIVELGGNDALRGLPLGAMRKNLTAIADASKAAGARVMLIGMQVPPNFGHDYADQFARTFRDVANDRKLPLVPFLLEGFADDLDAFQADHIHPLAKLQPRMLDNVWPTLEPLLKQ